MTKKIKQRDITDCGAACIASISAHYKLKLSVSQIRQLASTDKKGTNILGMIEALEKLGYQAKGVRGDIESLSKVPHPAIAHVVIKEVLHHYVVIYGVTGKHITVMDPADGKMHRYTHEEFSKIWTRVMIILLPGEKFQSGNNRISVLTRFWALISLHKSMMIQALVGALIYSLIGLSTSIYVQKIVDYVLVDGTRNLLNLMGVIMVVLLFLQIFVGAMKSVLMLRTGQAIDVTLILGYYKHLLGLPQSFFDSMRVGEIISRINDAVKIRTLINEVSVNFAVNIFIVAFSFALMFTYYWKLATVALIMIPFYGLIYFLTNRFNQKVERGLMENTAELESQLVESLNAVSTIKSFGLESFTNLKTESKFIMLLRSVYRSGLNAVFTNHSSEFISRLFTIILLWVGAAFALKSEITPGELLSFYALLGYFTGPVSSLLGMNRQIQNAVIAADRLFEIMDIERENQGTKVKLTPAMIGDISFQQVSFRYGSRVAVFKDLNLKLEKGKVTGIVGESGSGKSTLMALLQNLYPLQTGSIKIGDYDLKYVDNDSLRSIIGVVPQKIDLFAGNVVENIAIGDLQPDMNRIVGICSGLGILEFIEKLPSNFNTYLGENGISLSGGQRQRLAIARALYRDPDILILDEATSSLDSSSEQYVQKMIDILRARQKTVIIIAHRMSTIMRCDKIVVLQEGKVVEQGSHSELLDRRGHYLSFWQQQFPEAIWSN